MNNYWQFVPVKIPHLIVTQNDNSVGNGFLFYQMEPIQGSLALNNFYFSGSALQNPPIIPQKLVEVEGEVSEVTKLQSKNCKNSPKATKNTDKVVLTKKQKSTPQSKKFDHFSEFSSEEEEDSGKKGGWTSREEKKLKELVGLFGQQWKQICQYFPERNPKQIRERYLNYLRPNLSCEKWSPQEDAKILEYMGVHGRCWNIIEKKMKNRSQNQIKNRYYGHLKKMHDKNSIKDVQNQ